MGPSELAFSHVSLQPRRCAWDLIKLLKYRESRNPPIFPLHIALTSFPTPSPEAGSSTPILCDRLREIIPRFSSYAMSLDFLNKSTFSPTSKDEDLHAGVLQVPQSTSLFMTEFGIGEGRIGEKGTSYVC